MCVLFYCAVACYLYIQRSLLFAIYTYEFFYHAPKKLATFATFKNSTSGGRHARVAVLTPLTTTTSAAGGEKPSIARFAPYLYRIMNILKSGGGETTSELGIFATQRGQQLLGQLEAGEQSSSSSSSSLSSLTVDETHIAESYVALRAHFIDKWRGGGDMDVERCELKSGKRLFLCKKHVESTHARLVSNEQAARSGAETSAEATIIKMLEDLDRQD